MTRYLIVLLLLLVASLRTYGSNFHEHLFSLPTANDIAESADAIFNLSEEDQSLSSIFESERDVKRFLAFKLGKEHEGASPKTLKQLSLIMGPDGKKNLLELLSFPERGTLEERQLLYVDIEDLRKQIFLSLSSDEVIKIFARYFVHEPIINRQVVSATVTRRFFDEDQDGKYRRLRLLAEQYGSKLVYRVSLQRTVLLNKGIDLTPKVFKLIEEGEIGGIDVVGSLNEKKHVYEGSIDEISKRLTHLFDFISDRTLVLVFHLFEGMNDGPFYEALEKALRSYQKPLYLEVGHVAYLDTRWIEIFSSNPELNVMFHVNVQSNRLLQNRPLFQLRSTVKKLLAAGFSVVPGSDGRGILPGATYTEQVGLLECSLHDKSFLSSCGSLY